MTEVPMWEHFMAPSLRILSDGRDHRARDVREAVADELGLTEPARQEVIQSGQRRRENRANWDLVPGSVRRSPATRTWDLPDHGSGQDLAGPASEQHQGQ